MDNRSLDLGKLEKNRSDLYSTPVKTVYSRDTINNKSNLAISEQIYSEPEELPDGGKKQIEAFQQGARKKRLAIGFGIAGGVVAVGLVIGLTSWLVTQAIAPPPTTIEFEGTTEPVLTSAMLQRVDCLPEAEGGIDEVTPEACEDRGCIWRPSIFEDIPPCYTPQGDGFGYKVIDTEATALGQRWFLERLTTNGIFGVNFRFVTFEMEMRDDNTLRFKVDKIVL